MPHRRALRVLGIADASVPSAGRAGVTPSSWRVVTEVLASERTTPAGAR